MKVSEHGSEGSEKVQNGFRTGSRFKTFKVQNGSNVQRRFGEHILLRIGEKVQFASGLHEQLQTANNIAPNHCTLEPLNLEPF
jgi:hypothetical protein